MYEESCHKSSTSKYEKSNSNINISKISHLPFDMLCVFTWKMTTQCSINWQLAITMKQPLVQNIANEKKKKKKLDMCINNSDIQ